MRLSELELHKRYLNLARYVSTWSPDPSTKCGAVIVSPQTYSVIALGHNEFPDSCRHSPKLYEDRERKYERIIHAEANAILNCGAKPFGATLYTWPPGYGPSCARCTALIIQSGIKRVVYVKSTSDFGERWRASAQEGLTLYWEAGVSVLGFDESMVE